MVGRWRVGLLVRRGGIALYLAFTAALSCGVDRPPYVDLDPPCFYEKGPECEQGAGGESGAPGIVLTMDCELPPEAQALYEQRWEPPGEAEQPETCEEAVASKSYVGCEFWPTVTSNIVAYVFDFTVVVANTGTVEANVAVTRGEELLAEAVVQPDSLEKIYLPWVDELKQGLELCSESGYPNESARVSAGAYHLTSDRPVVAYQFNPLQFKNRGGPPDKDWHGCGEFSYTNDASLLLPVQALGTSYRGMTLTQDDETGAFSLSQPLLSITATADDTTVTVFAPPDQAVASGVGVPPIPAGSKYDFFLAQGEVVQLFPRDLTLSGALIESDKPVQVISGDACADVPGGEAACDHLEETLPPAQALGQRYLVAPPTGPEGLPIAYTVQLHGNRDGTRLYYPGGKPEGLPETLEAGEHVKVSNLDANFEVLGSHEFGVLLFLQGGAAEHDGETDPSQSMAVTLQQYRRRYVFLAPDDYTTNYADVIAPAHATVSLDGRPVTVEPEFFECSPYKVLRIWLDQSRGGIHVLEASEPVGVQVLGHASYTSYQYPGGLNVSEISEAPARPPVK